jgi:hypothetical protein
MWVTGDVVGSRYYEIEMRFHIPIHQLFIPSAVAFHQGWMRKERSTRANPFAFHHAKKAIVFHYFRYVTLRPCGVEVVCGAG